MNLYKLTVPYFDKCLGNMAVWIDKATDFAKTKNFDANTLLTDRLAPDQLPLGRQIMSTCDIAKFTCARAAGKTPPVHPDTETTFEDLKSRIRSVREYLKTFTPADFEGAESRKVTLPFIPGKYLEAGDYVLEFGHANFGFHLTTTYQLLRHNGVDLGKRDFLGALTLHDDV